MGDANRFGDANLAGERTGDAEAARTALLRKEGEVAAKLRDAGGGLAVRRTGLGSRFSKRIVASSPAAAAPAASAARDRDSAATALKRRGLRLLERWALAMKLLYAAPDPTVAPGS